MTTCPTVRARSFAWLGLAAALLLSPATWAAEPAGEWIKTSRGCEFSAWNSSPVPDEKIAWTGACDEDDVAHGTGTLQWYRDDKPTSQEKGQAVHGKWHGRVVSQLNEHVRYEGQYAWGRRIGLTRQFYSKAILEGLKKESPYREWIAEGSWEQDEFVLSMLYSRFAERRICTRVELDRDLCVSQQQALLATENAALASINQLGRCLNHAEMLAEVYIENLPDKKQAREHAAAYEKIATLAKKKGFADHMEAAQQDSGPAIQADIVRLVGPRLEALHQKDMDEKALQRAQGQLAIEVLAPYFQKNCRAFVQ